MGRGVREMGVSLPGGCGKGPSLPAPVSVCVSVRARAPGRAEGSPGGCVPAGAGPAASRSGLEERKKFFFLFLFICVCVHGFWERGFPGRKCFLRNRERTDKQSSLACSV